MTASDRTALVLYGSETGNAQDMAEELGKLFQRLHFKCRVEELDAVDLVRALPIVCMTGVTSCSHPPVGCTSSVPVRRLRHLHTGQGDMPHNSLRFWKKLLRKRLPPGCLAQLRFTCFGLGDSTYLKYAMPTPPSTVDGAD